MPIRTTEAELLLRALQTGGCRAIVFAGGDPSLRRDVERLVVFARQLGLFVEIQTNAQNVPKSFRRAILSADLVGLSLDGPTADVHDGFRHKRGNFEKVLAFLKLLDAHSKPVVVRTLVAKDTYRHVAKIGDVLTSFSSVVRWSLLQFSPIGDGFSNRLAYELEPSLFEAAAAEASSSYHGTATCDIYREAAKAGTYLLITPSGGVYGTTSPSRQQGVFPIVGYITRDHLVTLARSLPFSSANHNARYTPLLPRT